MRSARAPSDVRECARLLSLRGSELTADERAAVRRTLAEGRPPTPGDHARLQRAWDRLMTGEAAREELFAVKPPIKGRAAHEHGLGTWSRDAAGEVVGFRLVLVDINGQPSAPEGKPKRQTYALRKNGPRDGTSRIRVNGGGGTTIMVEGYTEKVLAAWKAATAAGFKGVARGWGSRPHLQHSIPPEDDVIVWPDREPADLKAAADHRRDMRRNLDAPYWPARRCWLPRRRTAPAAVRTPTTS